MLQFDLIIPAPLLVLSMFSGHFGTLHPIINKDKKKRPVQNWSSARPDWEQGEKSAASKFPLSSIVVGRQYYGSVR